MRATGAEFFGRKVGLVVLGERRPGSRISRAATITRAMDGMTFSERRVKNARNNTGSLHVSSNLAPQLRPSAGRRWKPVSLTVSDCRL
jgi:hypothetical protein